MKLNKLKERSATKLFLPIAICFLVMLPQQIFAHCDSYDGPVIQDAYKAFEAQDVTPVLKWVEVKYEREITDLFHKTLQYKNTDEEVYQLLEKHFLETLVRVHREGEGEPYTGLKPAGTTSQIIQMTDTALQNRDIDTFLKKLNGHIEKVVREKYEKAAALKLVKDNSVEEGRAYVAAYVDYTHTIEALHAILEHGAHHGE